MNQLVDELCLALRVSSGGDTDDVLLRTAFVFENYHGMPNDAWPDDIKSVSVSKKEADLLKDALKGFIGSEENESVVATAVWAFSKISDVEDINFIDSLLVKYIDGGSEIIYQVLCALGCVGVKVFPDGSSSMFDVERNVSIAKKYIDENCNE